MILEVTVVLRLLGSVLMGYKVQGLDLDQRGRLASTVSSSRRADLIAEQEAWAMNSDKKASEWVENMGHLGGKAMDNAGQHGMLPVLHVRLLGLAWNPEQRQCRLIAGWPGAAIATIYSLWSSF